MMLALETMDPTVIGIFFLIAAVLFILAAVGVASRFNLIAAGLAFCAVVWAWTAFAAS